ncbi:helix-turn-helix domain-containing protein [Leptospira interrogans]|uniref:Helix-turn-helix transcriptional regulator n=1 Tax=Leptospira interrogans serovar Canicola TaxID=211880 RepID=A0AAP9WCV1_LEPIR|nr:helix-turn-helix domain-containing protein [Leptospira interrogans]EMN54196.1 DNA-binding helix-turn-helix protein [Leptospira interrogans serovar Autumnalis str. LP101]QOI41689.1 helix-turn-helix transcriptional regulator [Leptospira interrogans serovar Canicola]QOI41710.1 helix-turn-helix transcriptional regulator [Leptospira interrogans serovar Canicola]WOT13172.1 helix-turn-helix domain-containing protein [Leptospira interrogans]
MKSSHSTEILAEKLGNNIRSLRSKKGWSQSELADKVGAHLTHINRIENGKYLPSLDTVVLLAEALECSLDILVNGSAESSKDIRIEDQSFAEKIRLLNSLDTEEKKAVTLFLDSLLSKKKMIGMLQELQIK